MTGPGESSLTARAITSISGDRSASAIEDSTKSIFLFTNRPPQEGGSSHHARLLSSAIEWTSSIHLAVGQGGSKIFALKDPPKTRSREQEAESTSDDLFRGTVY